MCTSESDGPQPHAGITPRRFPFLARVIAKFCEVRSSLSRLGWHNSMMSLPYNPAATHAWRLTAPAPPWIAVRWYRSPRLVAMNVCSATSVLCRTTPQWLVWMIVWWQEPSMLTTGYLISRCRDVEMSSLQVFRLVSHQRLIQTSPRPTECCLREISAAAGRRRQRSLHRGSGGFATFLPTTIWSAISVHILRTDSPANWRSQQPMRFDDPSTQAKGARGRTALGLKTCP
jgi:hypothetical protein